LVCRPSQPETGSADPGAHAAGSAAKPERLLMRASILSPDLPPQFQVFTAPQGPANDGYAEIMLGGLKTACLSRDQLSRLMLTDCLKARQLEHHVPKLVFAANGHA